MAAAPGSFIFSPCHSGRFASQVTASKRSEFEDGPVPWHYARTPVSRRVYVIEQSCEYQIDGHNQGDRGNDGRRGRASNLLGAGAGGETFSASDSRDYKAEQYTLDEAGIDVARDNRIPRRLKIGAECEAGPGDAEDASAHNAHEVGPDCEAWHHYQHRQKLWRDQEANWVNSHGSQGIHFLGHLLGAYLRGESGPRSANDNDGCKQRTKFAKNRNSHGTGHKLHRA